MMIKELIPKLSFFPLKPPQQRMSFGFHRAEVIGALTSVVLIWVVTAFLVYLAIQRTISLDFELDADIMLISSGFGILVNVM